jgi:collagen type VI alpha
VLQFADTPQVILPLNAYTSVHDITWVTQQIVFSGGHTDTAAALAMIKNTMFTPGNGDRSNAPNVVIMVTDGNTDINPEGTVSAAISLRLAGAHVITVSCGTDYNLLQLHPIASEPHNQTVFTVDSVVDLPSLRMSVLDATTNDVNFCSPNPCQFGGSCYNDFETFHCLCTPNWSGPTCAILCKSMTDLAIILDISGSGNFLEVLNINIKFVKELVASLPTDSGQFRVAVVTFGAGANISFYLNTYSTSEDILNALAFYEEMGTGDLDGAIQDVSGTIFNLGNGRGARPNVPKVAVIVTDSSSPGDYSAPVAQAVAAQKQGITFYAVLVGSGPDPSEFNAIVNNPLTNILTMSTAADIPSTVTKMTTLLCGA